MDTVLGRNWWAFVVRGLFAVLFGIAAIAFPASAIAVLVLIFGAYALIDGILAIVAARTAATQHRDWGIFALEGAASILFAVAAFIAPLFVANVFIYIFAFWAIVTGVLEIAAAIALRRTIRNEWLLGLSGVLSIVAGVLLFFFPAVGVVTFATVLGIYAILFGIALIALGFRLRGRGTQTTMTPSGV